MDKSRLCQQDPSPLTCPLGAPALWSQCQAIGHFCKRPFVYVLLDCKTPLIDMPGHAIPVAVAPEMIGDGRTSPYLPVPVLTLGESLRGLTITAGPVVGLYRVGRYGLRVEATSRVDRLPLFQ